MTGALNGDVEILVHIGAPSAGRDDARYRALAREYLQFQTAARYQLVTPFNGSHGSDNDVLGDSETPRSSAASWRPEHQSCANEEINKQICISDETTAMWLNKSAQPPNKSFMDSPSLSFNDVIDNGCSPTFKLAATRAPSPSISPLIRLDQTEESSLPWIPPPSEVADSQPDQDQACQAHPPILEVLALYLKEQQAENLRIQHQLQEGERQFDRNHVASLQIKQNNEPINIAPQSVNLSGRRSTTSARLQDILQPIPTPLSAVIDGQSVPVLDRLKRAQPLDIVPRRNADKVTTTADALISGKRSHEEMIASRPSSSAVQRTLQHSALSRSRPRPLLRFSPLWETMIEIRPPAPEIGLGTFGAKEANTADLRFLARKMPIHKLYRPAQQARELRDLERGYWLLDSYVWNREVQIRCWQFLGEYVGKSRAGWGVRCERAHDYSWIRTYCWGSIVGHIYLVLFLASENKIRSAKARWIGGDQEILISMDQPAV